MSMYPLVYGIGNVRDFSPVGKCQGDRPKSGMCQKSLVLENSIASLTYCSMVLHWWMVEGHVLPALSICCLSSHCGVFPRICTDICHVLVSVFSNSDK